MFVLFVKYIQIFKETVVVFELDVVVAVYDFNIIKYSIVLSTCCNIKAKLYIVLLDIYININYRYINHMYLITTFLQIYNNNVFINFYM